jgi:hypothetical protein
VQHCRLFSCCLINFSSVNVVQLIPFDSAISLTIGRENGLHVNNLFIRAFLAVGVLSIRDQNENYMSEGFVYSYVKQLSLLFYIQKQNTNKNVYKWDEFTFDLLRRRCDAIARQESGDDSVLERGVGDGRVGSGVKLDSVHGNQSGHA